MSSCRIVAEDVRRDLVEERLDDLEDLGDVVLERVVGVGVVLRVAGDLADVLAPVLAEEEVVAVLHRSERRRHKERHEAVLRQLEVVDDVRPEEAEGVRERREPEARSELLGDRRPADDVAPLEDERPQAGLGEVGPVDEAVVAAADDDRVVAPVARRGRLRCGRLRCLRLRRSRRGRLRHVRPSFARGCREAAASRERRSTRSGGSRRARA